MFLWYYQTWIVHRLNQHLRVTMIEAAAHLSLRYHNQSQTGDVIYRVYQDSAVITSIIESVILDPLLVAGMWVVATVTIFLFSPPLAVACLIAAVPVMWLVAWYTPRFQRQSRRTREATSRFTSRIQDSFAAIRMIKADPHQEKTHCFTYPLVMTIRSLSQQKGTTGKCSIQTARSMAAVTLATLAFGKLKSALMGPFCGSICRHWLFCSWCQRPADEFPWITLSSGCDLH